MTSTIRCSPEFKQLTSYGSRTPFARPTVIGLENEKHLTNPVRNLYKICEHIRGVCREGVGHVLCTFQYYVG